MSDFILTARDRFAIAALPQTIAIACTYSNKTEGETINMNVHVNAAKAATLAYAIADAMLAERTADPPPR